MNQAHTAHAHYDALETRSPEEREAALMQRLAKQVQHAKQHTPAYQQRLHGLRTDQINTRSALATLPVVRKQELMESQLISAAHDVFGGFSAVGWGRSSPQTQRPMRVFASPGPIHEPEGRAPNYWRIARALFAAGFRAGDLVHNAFSYHFTPAGSMMETGAHALGCTVFPAGTGQTEQQVQAIRTLRPNAYTGTPSFLKIILDKAAELGVALPSLQHALVGGEAFPVSVRDGLLARGIQAFQCYATADLGLIAYETSAREGLVLDEDVILEIVRPGTGEPVPDGEVGEVVVTTLNPDYPLIRFGTGDLSAVLPGPCPTGRSNTRIRGWLGRADQTAKVRGMFVHPSQVATIASRHPEVQRARLVVDSETAQDRMTLWVETAALPDGAKATLSEQLVASMRDVTKLRGEVQFSDIGSLPNDGKVVVDLRPVG
jgi:phenylacetate-CoA ligase